MGIENHPMIKVDFNIIIDKNQENGRTFLGISWALLLYGKNSQKVHFLGIFIFGKFTRFLIHKILISESLFTDSQGANPSSPPGEFANILPKRRPKSLFWYTSFVHFLCSINNIFQQSRLSSVGTRCIVYCNFSLGLNR